MILKPDIEKETGVEDKTDTTIPKGTERVLVIDDEMIIVVTASQMLERLGYTVTAKTSSTNALESFEMQPDNFDLIILDMNMPEIMGDKLAIKLKAIRPDIPIIMCTGFSKNLTDEKAKSIGICAVIKKPFGIHDLANFVRNVLDKS